MAQPSPSAEDRFLALTPLRIAEPEGRLRVESGGFSDGPAADRFLKRSSIACSSGRRLSASLSSAPLAPVADRKPV
jgi:hypothetical protein